MSRARSNRSGFEQRLIKTLRQLDVMPHQRLIVGFSGGADSLALSAALARVAPIHEIELLLVHVDHRLRPGSTSDAAECRRLAEHLELPIEVVALKSGLRDRSKRIGLEEAARRERFQALAAAAGDWGSDTILLAHQANDQAETVLLHLFRGSGLDGMAGMGFKERRRIPWWLGASADSVEVTLMRPLLAEPRSTIEEYVAATGLVPVDDESNRTTDFDRNWVRTMVLPHVQERWPAAVETIQRSARTLEIDRDDLNQQARTLFRSAIDRDRTLRTDNFATMDRSIAHRILRLWLQELEMREMSFDVVERLYSLALEQDEQRSVEGGAGVSVVLAGRRLMTFERLCERAAQDYPIVQDTGNTGWDIEFSETDQPEVTLLGVPEGARLVVRTIEQGDRWFASTRSVMDDLRTAKIHPLLRTRVIAITSSEGVLLIPAIYPTIHSAEFDGPVKKVGVRWSKRS